MNAFGTVLVATDGSPAGDRAVDAAIAIARRSHARLVISSVAGDAGAPIACAEAATRARAAGLRVREELGSGAPAEAIVRCARDAGADVVVVGTQGNRGLDLLMLGSTAAEVLRRSAIPTIVIPAAAEGAALTGRRRRLLVALDDSAPSDAAFDFASRYAEPGDSLVLCNVVETYGAPDRDRLERRAAGARAAGIPADVVVVDGVPGPAIVAAARAHGADAIVIGTHGRRGVQRMFLGSVAEAVVRASTVPVVVVRRNEADRERALPASVDAAAAASPYASRSASH